MTRRFIALASFALLMSACGGAATPPPAAPSAAPEEKSAAPEKVQSDPEQVEGAGARLNQRRVGDYTLVRLGGSALGTSLLLGEEVTAREDGYLVVEYTLDDGKVKTRLRARLVPETGEVVRVARLDGKEETPAELSAFQAMMDRTMVTPDYNEGVVGKKRATCLVAGKEADCVTTRYHVYVGNHPATLSVTTSKALPGRDVEGSIRDAHGELLYESQIVESRRGAPEPSLARRDAGLRYIPSDL